jgi:hypothetical protein
MYAYHQHSAIFKEWWQLLPRPLRRELASAAEDFASIGEYNQHLFSGSGMLMTSQIVMPSTWYEDFRKGLPCISQGEYKHLLTLPESSNEKAIQQALEQHFRAYQRYVKSYFGLGTKQPAFELRDRYFSKLNYEGNSYQKIAERWSKDCRTHLSDNAVKKAISRSRHARENEVWTIRLLIFVTGNPLMPSLRCPKCFGTGETPHESWSPAQRDWFEKWCKVGWRNWRPTDHAPDEGFAPAVPCSNCNATGKLKVSDIPRQNHPARRRLK